MNTLDHAASDTNYQTAIEAQEHALFAQLKPSLKKDGDQWCVLYGDNLQEGVAGFGDSPRDAVIAFNEEWYKPIPKDEVREMFEGTRDALASIKLNKELTK